MVRPTFVLLVAVACSSSKPRGVDDAKPPVVARPDAAAPPDAPVPPPPATGAPGDVAVRVEWKDVPVAARASPGRTACNSPRSPAVAPTTTWGIPDVLVIVEGGHAEPAEARVVLGDCRLAPRLAIGKTLQLASAADRPSQVTLAKRGDVARLDKLDTGAPRAIRLPIAGHAVTASLEPGGVYELASDGETAWIVAARGAVTEAGGQAIVRDVPAGVHAVTVWLPPRGGQPARRAKGTVTVVSGELADLTLALE